MSGLVEIDERRIMGNGGTVTLYQREAGGYLVTVVAPDGSSVAMIDTDEDGALEAFRHPFARTDVPNIFVRHAAEGSDWTLDAQAYMAEHAEEQ